MRIESLNNAYSLIQEAKKYKSAEEFVNTFYSKININKLQKIGNIKIIPQGTRLEDAISNDLLFTRFPSFKNIEVFINIDKSNISSGLSTSGGRISVIATSIKEAEILLNHEIHHRIFHKLGINGLWLSNDIDNYEEYINRPDEKMIRELEEKSQLVNIWNQANENRKFK